MSKLESDTTDVVIAHPAWQQVLEREAARETERRLAGARQGARREAGRLELVKRLMDAVVAAVVTTTEPRADKHAVASVLADMARMAGRNSFTLHSVDWRKGPNGHLAIGLLHAIDSVTEEYGLHNTDVAEAIDAFRFAYYREVSAGTRQQ